MIVMDKGDTTYKDEDTGEEVSVESIQAENDLGARTQINSGSVLVIP